MAWALVGGPVGVALGVGVGAAVIGTKVAIGALSNRAARPEPVKPDALPRPRRGTIQDQFLRRAQSAVAALDGLGRTPGDPWLRNQVEDLGRSSAVALPALGDLAGRVELLDGTLGGLSAQNLPGRLAAAQQSVASSSDARLRAERENAVRALEAQIGAQQRMMTLRETLLARMESAVLGLEGLVASTSEVVAQGSTSVDVDRTRLRLDGLSSDVETLRSGLAEAAAIAQEPY